MKRRILLAILALATSLCLVFGMVGCSKNSESLSDNGGNSSEAEDDESGNIIDENWITEGTEGLKYTLSSNKLYYTVSGIGTATDTDIVIPSEYEGLPVTAIGISAFNECTSLISVTIGSGIKSIGSYASITAPRLQALTYQAALKI